MYKSHQCNCEIVHKCKIYVHPSNDVQEALNVLVEVLTKYDETTGSKSVLAVRSKYPGGIFTSVTHRIDNGN